VSLGWVPHSLPRPTPSTGCLIARSRAARGCTDWIVIRRRYRLRGWRGRRSSGTWQTEEMNAFTVEAQLELLRLDVDRHLFVQVARQLNAYRVVRVHRERVPNRRTASRTEQLARQSFVLREIVRHTEVVDVWEGRRQPYRSAADFLGCQEIPLHERRRDFQYAGDIVKAIASIVGRKK